MKIKYCKDKIDDNNYPLECENLMKNYVLHYFSKSEYIRYLYKI